MDPRQLAYFVAVARCEHMGTAAAQLQIDESTLSRSVRRLEERFGVQLFDRVGRGVRLNNYGRILQEYATRALNEIERAEHEIRRAMKAGSSRIRLGFMPQLGVQMVPNLLTKFMRRFSRAEFQLTERPREVLRDLLLSGTIDLTLRTHAFDDAAVEWKTISNNRMIALLPSSHRLSKQSEIELHWLGAEALMIFRSAEISRDLLHAAQLTSRVTFESEDYASLIALVRVGYGIAIVPSSVGMRPPRGIKAAYIRSTKIGAIGLTWSRARELPKMPKTFRDFALSA